MHLIAFDKGQEKSIEKGTTNLRQYDSKYTYMEENEDSTYDLYIYSSAVQWNDGSIYRKIDNSIVETEKEGYVYENASNAIKTYFPKDGSEQFVIETDEDKLRFSVSEVKTSAFKTKYINLYGDEKEAVCYELSNDVFLYTYPINTGFHFEFIFRNWTQASADLEMIMDFHEMNIGDASGEYIIFNERGRETVIVYAPTVYIENSKQLYLEGRWSASKKNEKICLKTENLSASGEGKVHVEFSVQIHGEDMPDTTVYQNKEQNVYLSNRAIVGNNAIVGKGWHYARYRINYFFEINPETIVNAEFHTRNLNYREQSANIRLYSPKEQWSSTQMTWDNRIHYIPLKQNETCNQGEKGEVTIGLTKYVKQAAQDSTWITESLGSVMTCVNGYAVLATSDNGEYIPYLKITISEIPEKVIKRESINDDVDMTN